MFAFLLIQIDYIVENHVAYSWIKDDADKREKYVSI